MKTAIRFKGSLSTLKPKEDLICVHFDDGDFAGATAGSYLAITFTVQQAQALIDALTTELQRKNTTTQQ